MIEALIDWISSRSPFLLDCFRWILEAGFRGEKKVIQDERLSECKKLLDLGCGTGILSGALDKQEYTGIDLHAAYVRRAKRRFPFRSFIQMDARRLAFKENHFDCVVISGVLHHLNDADVRMILSECKRVLNRKSGKIVVWEDVPVRNKMNFIGSFVHSLDQGEHIRKESDYIDLFGLFFRKLKHYPMISGVCDYIVLVGMIQDENL
jgi:ubiquinone/menaquinone biosynthesis C-methylase UbiE